uniref:Glycosyltransferase RgtA/B/C/D-like domain-containing protein n=1 Tax=Candidatus Methanomethylicus mesodigestus TaxID=1867258 RepID=A0A7C3F2B5_9CREN
MSRLLRVITTFQKATLEGFFAVFAFVFITIALVIIITTSSTTGYEISIYDAYPIHFWVLLICSIVCGIIILVHQAFSEKKSLWWIIGFLIILFNNLVILLLPMARGYVTLGRGDVLTYIGYIKEMLYTGHFSSNIYPAIHVLSTGLSLISGLTPELLAELIPIFFILFYIFSIYLLAKKISSHRGQALLITAFGSLLLFGISNLWLAPAIQCFEMLPITIFLFLKVQTLTKRLSHFLSLIIVLLITPFFHPGDGTLFLLLILLCFSFSIWIYRNFNHFKQETDSFPCMKDVRIWYPILTLFITWFAWFSYTSTFNRAITAIWDWVLFAKGQTTAMEYFTYLNESNLSVLNFIHLFLNMYGQVTIYCLIALVISIVTLKRFLTEIRIEFQQLNFSILFVVFLALLFVAFFSNMLYVNYTREMRYVIFAATIITGLGLYPMCRNKFKQIGIIVIVVVLIASTTFGIFNTFPSPITRTSNSQVTSTEMTGMTWFLAHQDSSLLIDDLGSNQLRFAHAIRGVHNIPPNIVYISLPPDHFGYDKNITYGGSYTTDRYFINSIVFRVFYPSLYPEYPHLWRFTPSDFYQLDHEDPSVNRIYSNGEFWVYLVHGTGIAN